MRKVVLIILLTLFSVHPQESEAQTFARGADVSWCSEMEATGKKFYNDKGQNKELMQLLSELGMNAIRLRVWVDPAGFGYGAWSDKADVLAKARRVRDAGMDLMIDFHYSDFFADPGTQTKPASWAAYSMEELKQAVADHTTDILQALKDEGIEPRWVQVGNEINSGMIWEEGRLWTTADDKGWGKYVALSNAGYDAVKAVLPDAYVIVHHASGADNPSWFYTDFKKYGGKLDMIGLSHYPEAEWEQDNTKLANAIRKMAITHRVPIMVVETGYNSKNQDLASQVMTDLFTKVGDISLCAGIFYWEPEVFANWRPAYYTTIGWPSYSKGAFTSLGRPGKALDAFRTLSIGIDEHKALSSSVPAPLYDLNGRVVGGISSGSGRLARGLYISRGKKVVF
ncbi:MAG: glycosyl hydrolase 53 family protein [Bacteroidaceae bacterium]|nr:glycosyl hydrolase 53 family protein [Bacteroidaceae bacterium]